MRLQIKLNNYSSNTMKINFLFAAALLFSINIGVKAQQMPADYVQANELGELLNPRPNRTIEKSWPYLTPMALKTA